MFIVRCIRVLRASYKFFLLYIVIYHKNIAFEHLIEVTQPRQITRLENDKSHGISVIKKKWEIMIVAVESAHVAGPPCEETPEVRNPFRKLLERFP